MNELLYNMIFKRKSFHIFRETGEISVDELMRIDEICKSIKPLYDSIKTEIKIVSASDTTCKRGQEYCILFYSENKPGYLQNIGYIGEQIDLQLAAMDIGALWFGIGKTDVPSEDNLDYIIMIAIAKIPANKFRKDMFKSKRKPLSEIWEGDTVAGVSDIVRFAPSACNSQPWIVERNNNSLTVYRYKESGKRGIMPADKVSYYNQIDIGIFLLFMDICLGYQAITFERTLYQDSGDDAERNLVAKYLLHPTDFNLAAYEKTVAEYNENPVTYTHEEVRKMLELD